MAKPTHEEVEAGRLECERLQEEVTVARGAMGNAAGVFPPRVLNETERTDYERLKEEWAAVYARFTAACDAQALRVRSFYYGFEDGSLPVEEEQLIEIKGYIEHLVASDMPMIADIMAEFDLTDLQATDALKRINRGDADWQNIE